MDWSGCPDVEALPGKVSGLALLKNTRVQADSIIESVELGRTPEQVADDYRISIDSVNALLAYASCHPEPAPSR